jgi:hypothetical protein
MVGRSFACIVFFLRKTDLEVRILWLDENFTFANRFAVSALPDRDALVRWPKS